MMDSQLKLQAYLDGELPEAEARAVAEALARDPDAAALLAELRETGLALARFEQSLRLPESREFFWSKVQREMQRREAAGARVAAPARWWASWPRFLAPASTLALLAAAALLAARDRMPGSEMQTARNDPAAMTYRDYDAKATLIWLSYPAEKEFALNEPNAIIQ